MGPIRPHMQLKRGPRARVPSTSALGSRKLPSTNTWLRRLTISCCPLPNFIDSPSTQWLSLPMHLLLLPRLPKTIVCGTSELTDTPPLAPFLGFTDGQRTLAGQGSISTSTSIRMISASWMLTTSVNGVANGSTSPGIPASALLSRTLPRGSPPPGPASGCCHVTSLMRALKLGSLLAGPGGAQRPLSFRPLACGLLFLFFFVFFF